MQLLIKNFFNYLKIAGINLLILLIIIIIIELIFGYWFKKDNWGNQIRSFCNVSDAVDGLIQVLEKGKLNETYNIGNNNEPISMSDLAERFVKIADKNIKIKKVSYDKSDRSKSREIFKRYPDLKRVFKDTKYRPKKDLNVGIKELIDL